MRKYQPIWEALKKDLTVSLAAPLASHRRIRIAVRKEKNKDLGWKLICSDKGNSYKLHYEIDGKLMIITLEVDRSVRNL